MYELELYAFGKKKLLVIVGLLTRSQTLAAKNVAMRHCFRGYCLLICG